jgi:RNA polymerase sigma-70 factor (ECF subfamily)
MNLNSLSDEELMVMYQSGAEDAFEILYRRHSDKVYGFLRGRIWNDERAAELFQETFLKIHRSKQLYNKSLPAMPWIFSITKSVLNDGLRKQKKFDRDKDFSSDAHFEVSEDRKFSEVTDLLAHLSEDQRVAVQLRYVDEKTFEEIALALRTSPGNVRKIVSRAVTKLKAVVKKGDKS